jgi:putative FmdB family regulatory protein
MPTYEYECAKCKKSFDLFQSMKDSALTICPREQCRQKTWGKGKVRRKLGTGAGLIFKGSGFYITDYRSEGYKASAKKESPSEPKKSDTPATTTASSTPDAGSTKPAPKKDSKKD